MAAPAELTPIEREVVAAAAAGRRAEAKGDFVRAFVIRDLITERVSEWTVAPVGLDLHDATIEGELDLEGCTVTKPVAFLKCRFAPGTGSDTAIRLRDAQLKRLALYDCRITGAIKADRANVASTLALNASVVEGEVRLRGATIGEALTMEQADLRNPSDTAILADGMKLGGPWILRTANIKGEVRFAGARIAGGLLWEDVTVARSGVAVIADGAYCESVWVLRRARITGAVRLRGTSITAIDAMSMHITAASEAFNARAATISGDLVLDGAQIAGGVLLSRARVGGEIAARGARISGPGDDWAIAAAGVNIDQGLAIGGATLTGGLSVAGARIRQGISASKVTIAGKGRAIEADVVQLGGNWIMRGAVISGSVRFAGAQIDGQVGFTECTIDGSGDLAIRADGADIRGGWFMGRARLKGLLRFPAARLGNEMRLRGTAIEVVAGPAIYASGVRIAREFVLDGGFKANGCVALDHAEIEGTLELSGSRMTSALIARNGAPHEGTYDAVLQARYDDTVLSLVDARLDRLVMPSSAEDRPRGIVDLSRARVGSYEDFLAAWPPSAAERRKARRRRRVPPPPHDFLVLDGFDYEHLANPAGIPSTAAPAEVDTGTARLRWLESQSLEDLDLHFKPQAWMQLTKRLVAQGFHDDARQIAIGRRRRHRRAATATTAARLQGLFLDVFALYGFNPWRTVVWMAVFILLFAGVWWGAAQRCERPDCKDETVFVMALKGNFGQDDNKAEANYPPFSPLAYSLDVFLPFVNLGFEEHWRPKLAAGPAFEWQSPPLPVVGSIRIGANFGSVLTVLYMLEVLIGLVMTSLAVTGFTGLLRGEEEPK